MLEMVFAELLLFTFIAFVLLLGRVLSERNRLLAANRTVAWLYTHCEDMNACQKVFASDDFSLLMRRWHFKDSGRGTGIVRVGAGEVGSGAIVSDPEGANKESEAFTTGAQKLFDGQADQRNTPNDDGTVSTEKAKSGYADIHKDPDNKHKDDKDNNVLDAIGGLVTVLVNYITQDFTWYRADVSFGMPVSSSGLLQKLSTGQTYVFIRPGSETGCVFPILNAGSDSAALKGLSDLVQGFKDEMQEQMSKKKPENCYRPYMVDSNGNLTEELDGDSQQGRFHWLLVYEINDDADTAVLPQKEARNRAGD